MEIRTISCEKPCLSHAQHWELSRAVRHALTYCPPGCGEGGEQRVYNRLRVKLNLWHIEDVCPDQLPEALRIGAVEAGFKRLFQLQGRTAGVSLPGSHWGEYPVDAARGEAVARENETVDAG